MLRGACRRSDIALQAEQRAQAEHVAHRGGHLNPPAQPRGEEVVLTGSQRDQIVAVERQPNVTRGGLGAGTGLHEVVHALGVEPGSEDHIEVPYDAEHAAFRDVFGTQRGVDAIHGLDQPIERSAALLRRGHAQTLVGSPCSRFSASVQMSAPGKPAPPMGGGRGGGCVSEAPEAVEEPTEELTGVPAVDAALERLRDIDAAPVESHVEIFDDVQRQLHDALAELDDGQ